MWDESTETPLLLLLGPGVNALLHHWFGQRDSTIYFLTGKRDKKRWTKIWIGERSPPAEDGCCASRQEENGSYGRKQSWNDVTPTNHGNRVQKEFLIFVELVFFFFFVIPSSWIDTAVAWSSNWASPPYQAVGDCTGRRWGRKSPSHCLYCALRSPGWCQMPRAVPCLWCPAGGHSWREAAAQCWQGWFGQLHLENFEK